LREALNYYKKSESLDLDLRDSISVAVIDRSLANVYAQLGNIREAEQLAYSAYKYLRLKNDRNFIGALLVLGKVHLQKGSYYKSSDYLEEAYQTAQKNSMPFLAKEASENLAKVYLQLKQYDKSIFYQTLYSRINDSLQSANIGKQLAHMQVRYESERKEKAIEHLELENNKKELELTRKRDQVILITSVFVCVMAIFIAFYFYSNARKQHLINLVKQRRQKEIIETIITTEEKARKKIAADLHDGLGQILTAAKINLANLNEALPQEREKLAQVTELVNSAQYESKNMALNLMPLTLKENGLIESIKRICVKYNKPEVQEISFNAYDVPDQLEPVVEINTYRICQELLNNAVKYSKAAKIFLQLFCREGKLIIQIEDNGIGFDKTKTKADSLGMNTLKERVALLKGEIEIDTAPQKGTNIFIELSLH
jgi:signal transduction histidine kinase